jgi:hypothetical protein
MDQWFPTRRRADWDPYSINIINEIALRHWRTSHKGVKSAAALGDSLSALQTIHNPGTRQIIHAILQAAMNTKTP